MPRDLGSELPEDGELRVGGVSLPAGRRVLARYGDGEFGDPVDISPVADMDAGEVLAGLWRAAGRSILASRSLCASSRPELSIKPRSSVISARRFRDLRA